MVVPIPEYTLISSYLVTQLMMYVDSDKWVLGHPRQTPRPTECHLQR